MPLTLQTEGERQERETGAGNLIHLVFIWPSKTTPRSIAIQSAVDVHVCASVYSPVCSVRVCVCDHVFSHISVQARVHLWA